MSDRCQCPHKAQSPNYLLALYSEEELPSANHEENECASRSDLRLYLRDGKEIMLCSGCTMIGDEPV